MSDSKWTPPDKNEFKTNYDGVVFQETNEAGIGVMIQNNEGEVLGALSEKIALPGSVVMVEMLAAGRVVQFALEIGITHSVFEGDSEIIDEALSTDVTPLSSFGMQKVLFWLVVALKNGGKCTVDCLSGIISLLVVLELEFVMIYASLNLLHSCQDLDLLYRTHNHIGFLLITSVDYVGVDFKIKLLTIGGKSSKLTIRDIGIIQSY